MSALSAYERQRDANIAENHAALRALGLEPPSAPRKPTPRNPTPRQSPKQAARPEATRASKRVRSSAPDYTGTTIDAFGDDEPRLRKALRREADDSADDQADDPAPPPKSPRKASPKAVASARRSAVIDAVRAFVEENVPDGYTLEEREMFGTAMWLVRGNMFLGVGLRTERLLVRVGEAAVEAELAGEPEGVARCGTPGGRTFTGTLMVAIEQYRGDAQLRKWFELALAYNEGMEAKEPAAKPRKRKAPKRQTAADEDEGEGGDSPPAPPPAAAAAPAPPVAAAPPLPRPASTSGGQFAKCVLHVIKSIPRGKVASYGQVAALAGAPRNARQVGSMLRDGLAAGGAPWFRVLGSSGKISLPANGGGDTQKAKLVAEGVAFGASGAVTPGSFWDRGEPFFA